MSPIPPQYDRALAYAIVGALAVLSAPPRPWLAVLVVIAMAVGLEVAQRFTIDRHGQFVDVLEKLVGVMIGSCSGYIVRWLVGARSSPTP